MLQKKRIHPTEKDNLHPRNKHRQRYNFQLLIESCSGLSPFVGLNKFGDESIDFFDPAAVRMLNKALLKHFYSIEDWDIPEGYLCPPIPGRADYLHHMADLLSSSYGGKVPTGENIKCLDIGVGANCVYPLIGVAEYGWSFTGSDIDPVALTSAAQILESNPHLKGRIDLRLQTNPSAIFNGLLKEADRFDLTFCNPPFHGSAEEARSTSLRKINNLRPQKSLTPILNFGGQSNELWCKGGEEKFIREMIRESYQHGLKCFWFSTLISKKSTLELVLTELKRRSAMDFRIIPLAHGNKISRILTWTFLTTEQKKNWTKSKPL